MDSPERTAGEVGKIVGRDPKKLKLAVFMNMTWRPEDDGMWRPFPEDLESVRITDDGETPVSQ